MSLEQVDEAGDYLRLLVRVGSQRLGGDVSRRGVAHLKVRVGEHVEKAGDAGLGADEEWDRLVPVALPVSHLTELCERQGMIGVELQLCLKLMVRGR